VTGASQFEFVDGRVVGVKTIHRIAESFEVGGNHVTKLGVGVEETSEFGLAGKEATEECDCADTGLEILHLQVLLDVAVLKSDWISDAFLVFENPFVFDDTPAFVVRSVEIV
jgi:hypothetical protein